MLESVASGTLGVIWTWPDIKEPEDTAGASCIRMGGDSISKPSLIGFAPAGERGPSRACLSLDNARSFDFAFSCELCFLANRVGRLR